MEDKDRLVEILEKKFCCNDVSQLVEFLVEGGLMKPKAIKYYLIKDDYYNEIKKGEQSCTDIKLDLAANYDTSFPTVKKIIYSMEHIKP